MSNNNKQNSSCGFAEEELISYFYGEFDSMNKAEFEKHLDQCSNCIDEMAAFGLVRSSIGNWRDEVFLAIEPPQIEIPYSKNERIIATDMPVSNSWFDRLQQLFTQTPVWATTSAAIAIVMVLLSTTFIILNSSNSVEIAEVPNPIEKNAAEKNPAGITVPEVAEIPAENSPEQNIAKTPEITDENSPVKRTIDSPKQNVLKTSNNSNGSKIPGKKNIKPNDSTIAKETGNKNNKLNPDSKKVIEIPNLSNLAEDENDDSLRLADLFDEVGSKK